MIDGLAVVDKPAGMTSHDVVARCRKIFGQRRVGHAGTLDPDATGVLLVGVGRVTRLMRWMSGHPKSYTAEVVLGVATSTLDSSGEVTGRWDMSGVGLTEARRAALCLTGDIEQVPPMVSALKVGGKRLHALAREGVEVERAARPVRVTRFELDEALGRDPGALGGGPVLALRVDCSAGTYVRSLAADLGTLLGGGAHLRRLRRIASGPWSAEDAVALDALCATDLHPPAAAIPDLQRVEVSGDLLAGIRNGRVLDRRDLAGEGGGPWAVLAPGGELVAVYEAQSADRVKPAVVIDAC